MDSTYVPSLDGGETNKVIAKLGIKKANTKIWQLFLLGVLAGLYIGMGGHFSLVALASGMGRIAAGVVFSFGLILVVIAGAELFTGNVTIMVGVLSRVITKRSMVKNWTIVYIGNLAGSLFLAWLVYRAGLLGHAGALNGLGVFAAEVAENKIAIPFMQAFIRGILCNILVILAIIMSIMAKDLTSKILCIIFPITCFVACGFEHSVANMYLIPIGLFAEGLALYEMSAMFRNIVPVTLGNIIGGIFILVVHPNRIRQIRHLFDK